MTTPITATDTERAAALVARMTVEEQATLLSGDGWWRTHGIARVGLAPITMTDGPHGLRKAVESTELGLGNSVPATCFPTAVALASSWNPALVREVGAALGREAQASDVQILLGPGINIKRSPLGGRNFEYFSEDPLLAGKLAAAYIDGLQGEGVGASLKHFAVNSQETERMATSSDLDERTLHEIYLAAFEIAVREARPWSVMSAYNLVNGTHASEHRELLTGILRERWGFEGFVVSDWGGTNDRAAGVAAGNDLEMPGSGEYNRRKILAAVADGRLSREAVAASATRLVAVMLRAVAARRAGATFDAEAHHALARRAAAEAIVLLKNDARVLPLPADGSVALIGAFASTPRYQGAGSSQVRPIKVASALGELTALLGSRLVQYAPGYDEEGEATEAVIAEAVRCASAARTAIVFAGLPDSYESEGFDRRSIDLPPGHVRLIEAVSAAQPNVAVVLMNGAAVSMPWAGRVRGIVEAWLGGQAGGGAIADVLTGRVNPSGRLPETFPAALSDASSFPFFPGRDGHANYGEGVFVGYRHHATRRIEPMFPFGFGLSFTRFEYADLRCAGAFDADGAAPLVVEVDVRNAGEVAGQQVVQLYVHERSPRLPRPDIELRAFEKIALDPGQTRTIRFELGRRAFAFYDAAVGDWAVNPGLFELRVGPSAGDLPLRRVVEAKARVRHAPLTRRSMVQDFKARPEIYAELFAALGFADLLEPLAAPSGAGDEQVAALRKARMSTLAFANEMMVHKVPAFSHGRFSDARLDEILRLAASGGSS